MPELKLRTKAPKNEQPSGSLYGNQAKVKLGQVIGASICHGQIQQPRDFTMILVVP